MLYKALVRSHLEYANTVWKETYVLYDNMVIGAIQDLSKRGRPWRARGARAYKGGLVTEIPAGSRGRASGGGARGEGESFSSIFIQKGPKV